MGDEKLRILTFNLTYTTILDSNGLDHLDDLPTAGAMVANTSSLREIEELPSLL